MLDRNLSKENLNGQLPTHYTLRNCTSQKAFTATSTPKESLRVGSYSYRETDLLGKGFSSKVYRAQHLITGQRNFAIKIINLKKFKPCHFKMLQNEIEVHKTLEHPNIVKFYESYKTQNHYYIITEYCPHGDLMEYLRQRKRINQPEAQIIIEQIIEGYSYLVKRSIFHRDLKPANIFKNGETWKIGDFGFSIFCEAETIFDKMNVGTPLYMPLESLKANKYSFKSDIFSIGVILCQMLTGRTPWQCKNEKELIQKMIKCEPIKLGNVKNQKMVKFIERCCNVSESIRLTASELNGFFSNTSFPYSNPQQKQNKNKESEIKTLKSVVSLKFIRQQSKPILGEQSKNKSLTTVNSYKFLSIPSSNKDISTQASEMGEHQNTIEENYKQNNNRLILQELQFCRLIYYMTRNIEHFPIGAQAKNFFVLTLYKHLLKSIKELGNVQKNFSHQIKNMKSYKNERSFKQLEQQIKGYAERYQKQYLNILKNSDVSVIKSVNKMFPQLSYSCSLGGQFYANFYTYLTSTLRLVNHNVSQLQIEQIPPISLNAAYQAVDTLYSYCEGIKGKMNEQSLQKTVSSCVKINPKVVMDYKFSKLEKRHYVSLRAKIRGI